MNTLIVGASAGLGRALAESLARQGHHLLLVASDARDLDVVAADLKLRFDVPVATVACHIAPENDWLRSIIDAAANFEALDGLFFPIGLSSIEDRGDLDEPATRSLIEANLFSVMLITAHFLPAMIARRSGRIVGFGSIAAVRGRGANVIYSAAKKALLSYFESVRHLTSQSGIRVQFYQLGYLDTEQTFGKKLLFPKADPQVVANYVVSHLQQDVGTRYYPRFWALIAIVLRLLPWRLFRNLKF